MWNAICELSISRGGKNTKIFNTTNLVQHLRSKHIAEFKKYQKAQEKTKIAEQQTSSNDEQLTLEATEDHVKLWNSCDP